MSHQHSSGNERAAKDGLMSAVGAVVVAVAAIVIFFGLNATGHTNPDLVGGPAMSASSTMTK
jgi:hypothetical protein